MSFWTRFKESFYSQEAYKKVATEPLSSVFWYYINLIALLALLSTGVILFRLVPNIQAFTHEIVDGLVTQIPDNFVLRIKDNIATANNSASEPLLLDFGETTEPAAKKVMVIDTEHDFSYETFDEYGAYVWVTKSGIGFEEEPGKVSFQKYEDIKDLTLTRGIVTEKLTEIRSRLWILYVVLVPLMFLGLFLFGFFDLLYLLILGLIVWGIARLRGVSISYVQAYAVALYAATPALVFFFLQVFAIPFQVPFGFTLVLLLAAALALDPKLFEEKTA